MSSLFTSLGVAGSALSAAGTAVRTVGQNIANANSEGYTRQRVQLIARLAQDMVRFQIGTGVEVARIERVLDRRLEEMLRDARSSLGDLDARDRVLGRVETLLGELDGDSIASALSLFFDAAENLVNQPQDHSARSLMAARGADLALTIRRVDAGLRDLRRDQESEVAAAVEEVNRLAVEIAQLNDQVVAAENGGQDRGAANDLRDRREELVKRLSDLVKVKVVETSSGSLNVLSGSDFLVLDTTAHALALQTEPNGDVLVSQVRFASDGKGLALRGGKLQALLDLRDRQIPDLRGEIDGLAKAVISEVNRIHSQGEGLARFQELTGATAVSDPRVSLAASGLLPRAKNGSFDLRIASGDAGQVQTYNVSVDLDGLNGDDTTLEGLAAAINAAVGPDHPQVVARVTREGRLSIESGDPSVKFGFGNDTSGVLAGLGLNTFFTGRGAADVEVNRLIQDDPRFIATGRGAGETDATNVSALAALRDAKVLAGGGATLEDFYRGTAGVLGVDRARAQGLLQNQLAVLEHLQNERAAVSGVNIDEESIDLMRHQRAYEGAARVLTVIDSLLETLLNA
jgi:flagellar hook-associated protein 1 FlgK